jgi:hypothetical protein
MMKKLWYEPATGPSSRRPKPKAGGTGCGSGPKPIETSSRNTTSMPSSASTGASGGAPRSTSGRTVSRSVNQPMTSITASTRAMPTGYGSSQRLSSTKPPKAPSTAHSPTAKLMMPVGRVMSR